jgi:diguanylate cyclase (GGDEF)-like protein
MALRGPWAVAAGLALTAAGAMAAWSAAAAAGLPAALPPALGRTLEIGLTAGAVFGVCRVLIGRLAGAHERMALMARTDPLTGLANRRGLIAFFEAGGAAPRPPWIAVLHIDLDHFKVVNDTLGHDAGDHVLRVAAARMRACLGGDDVLARTGGDEFCAVLPGAAGPLAAEGAARRLVAALGQPIDYRGAACRVGASVGIASGRVTGREDGERMLMDADLAAGEAKAAGRGRVARFDRRMREDLERERDIAARLVGALERGGIVPHFQPVTSPDGRRVLSVEALAHWNDPARGVIPPPLFLGIADRHNLIEQITERMLGESLAALRRWQDAGLAPPRLSLNMSATELRREGAVARIEGALETAGIAPARLAIEVREAVCHARGHEIALAALAEIAALGVEVTLDDFGEDQAAVANLQKLRVASAKIDRQLVARIGGDQDSIGLVRALAGLARSMQLSVYAKGVETAAQTGLLAPVCDGLQGAALAPPMPEDRFADWLARRPPGPALADRRSA